ncbi:MAG: hypothetical protein WBW13_11080 [Pseudolabrys sp.]|jgi:hypothetical protein
MRRCEFITLLGGPAVLATRAQPGTGLAYIRVCSDGSDTPQLRLFGRASWVGDSPLARLERD